MRPGTRLLPIRMGSAFFADLGAVAQSGVDNVRSAVCTSAFAQRMASNIPRGDPAGEIVSVRSNAVVD